MNVEVGSLRLKVLHAQLPPPPQYDMSSRRSLAVGTRSDEPGVRHAVTQQSEQEGTFSFQAGVDSFLHVDCILKQERTISFRADVEVNPEITTVQAAARQEFARPLKNRQQRGVIRWSAEQNKMLGPGG